MTSESALKPPASRETSSALQEQAPAKQISKRYYSWVQPQQSKGAGLSWMTKNQ